MSQSKNPETKPSPSGEEQVNKGQTQPPVETVEEADPEKKSTYPVQWDYHVLRIQDTAARLPAHELDDLGREGWEMVSIFHLHATINFVFKRFVLQPMATRLSGVEELEAIVEE